MAVRNFYIKAHIDGRRTPLAGGPARRDGGFDLTLTQRQNGTIQNAADILARVSQDGTLTLRIQPSSSLSWTWTGSQLVITSTR